jgi:polysaccharide export outer membrane protein
MRLEQGVFLAGYGVSLTDELTEREGFLKSAAARASSSKLLHSSVVKNQALGSEVRSMTRIIVAAIAFAFGAAMSAQAGDVSPPSFGPSGCANSTFFSCRDARPVSQDQVETTPKREATRGTDARAVGTAVTQKAPRGSDARAAHPAKTSPAQVYQIGPMDVLDISVFMVPELTKTVQVADTGTINLPLVGELPAAGKTTQQLERELTTKLGDKYLQNPQVTVMLKENNSQHVTVQGAVEKPGVYALKGKTTLLELVAMAGGFKDTSDSTVLVLRNGEGKRSAAKFDVADIQKGQAQDPTMQTDDVVVAGTSAIKKGFNAVLKALPLAGLFSVL